MTKNAIQVRSLSKSFTTAAKHVHAIEDMTLDVTEGSFVTLVGASGCGKSTLLRMIGGLERSYSGTILVHGQEVAGPGPDRALVFQSYSLYPWLTVAENIAFASRLSGHGTMHAGERQKDTVERARRLMHLVGLEPFANSYPSQLSGGMQQRVAIARALLQKPSILLMDEPFGALDEQTRELMQDLLLHIFEVERMTVVFVTHDVEEAIYLGNKVVVLAPSPGRIDSAYDVSLRARRTQETKLAPEFLSLLGTIRQRIKATSIMAIDAGMLEALSLTTGKTTQSQS